MTLPDLLPRVEAFAAARTPATEPAHDFLHVQRVTRNARRIAEAEGADLAVVLPAALLHELFNYPKDHPQSSLSGEVCAERAEQALAEIGYDPARIPAVGDCIRTHSFSRGLTPKTLEGRVLQDADRLDALGAVGIARCFATGAAMGRPFYDPEDPFCRTRPPDDKAWTLDHFYRKLLRLPETLHTPTSRALAAERVAFLHDFLAHFRREIEA